MLIYILHNIASNTCNLKTNTKLIFSQTHLQISLYFWVGIVINVLNAILLYSFIFLKNYHNFFYCHSIR